MIVELGTPPHTLCDVCLCVESRGWSTESYSLDHNESGIFWCYHRHSIEHVLSHSPDEHYS